MHCYHFTMVLSYKSALTFSPRKCTSQINADKTQQSPQYTEHNGECSVEDAYYTNTAVTVHHEKGSTARRQQIDHAAAGI